MITILLAIDGITFFVVLAILSIIFIVLSAIDEPSPQGSSVVLLISLALAVLFTEVGPAAWTNPWAATLYIGCYFIIGCIYSIFMRWPLYLYGLYRQLKRVKEEILNSGGFASGDSITPSHTLFRQWCARAYDIGRYNGMHVSDGGILVPPQYRDNKARLLTWAILWPWNVLWVCVRKPIIWIFEELLNLQILSRISQAMSNWMFKDFNK
jgi:hypothetical protein